MIVARQFIAWELRAAPSVPLGYGTIVAVIYASCSPISLRNFIGGSPRLKPNHTVPYGTVSFRRGSRQ
jgi:hypothetical protein